MAMGKWETQPQQALFITHDQLPRSPGHVFYLKLNGLLREAGFDRWVEASASRTTPRAKAVPRCRRGCTSARRWRRRI